MKLASLTKTIRRLSSYCFSLCVHCSQRLFLLGIFLSSLQLVLVPCGGVKRRHALHYCVVYILWSFVITFRVLFNPFMPSGLFYCNALDKSIFYKRVKWLVLFYNNHVL